MSHNEKSPSVPVHDTRESQPGTDSTAPSDGSHPHARTDAAGRNQRPRQLKAPETANDKLTALDTFRKGSENYALTTNQGVRIADDQNSLRAGSRGPTLLEDFILREKVPTLTMSVSRRGSFTPADQQRTAIFSHIKT